MAYPKNSKSALLALATAGGLWAWQNRTKLAGMWQQMQSSRRSEPFTSNSSTFGGATTSTPMSGGSTYSGTTTDRPMNDEPYTDATTRLRDKELGRDF